MPQGALTTPLRLQPHTAELLYCWHLAALLTARRTGQELLRTDAEWVPDQDGFSLYIRPVCVGTKGSLAVTAATDALLYTITSPVGPYFSGGFAPVKVLPCHSLLHSTGLRVNELRPRQRAACGSGCALTHWARPGQLLAENNFKRAWPGGTGDTKVGGNYAGTMMPARLAAESGCSQIL